MSAQIEVPVEGELVAATRNAIAEFDPFEAELAEFRERYDGVVYDLDDEAQNKQARSDRHAIGKVISKLDSQHKAIKGPLLDVTRELDGVRKVLKDGFLEVQGRIKSQIEAHEAKEQARINDIAQRIEDIRMQLAFDAMRPPTAAELSSVIEAVQAIPIDDSFDEWKGSALLAKTETVEALEKLLADRQKYEAEQAELERLRAEKEQRERAEREARIAAEAADRAKREAEAAAEKARLDAERKVAEERGRAERERQEAAEKAERELTAANRRAERAADQERGRIEREQEEAERKAAAERAAEEARKAKQKHRAKIHIAIADALIDNGLADEQASVVIEAVKDGNIPHMQIVY